MLRLILALQLFSGLFAMPYRSGVLYDKRYGYRQNFDRKPYIDMEVRDLDTRMYNNYHPEAYDLPSRGSLDQSRSQQFIDNQEQPFYIPQEYMDDMMENTRNRPYDDERAAQQPYLDNAKPWKGDTMLYKLFNAGNSQREIEETADPIKIEELTGLDEEDRPAKQEENQEGNQKEAPSKEKTKELLEQLKEAEKRRSTEDNSKKESSDVDKQELKKLLGEDNAKKTQPNQPQAENSLQEIHMSMESQKPDGAEASLESHEDMSENLGLPMDLAIEVELLKSENELLAEALKYAVNGPIEYYQPPTVIEKMKELVRQAAVKQDAADYIEARLSRAGQSLEYIHRK